MSAELELPYILQTANPGRFPLICMLLRQKWTYSHYIHGKNAYAAGIVAGMPEEVCKQVASATEIVWAAILILDDIVDGDEMRYHAPSAWKTAGYPAATREMTRALLEGVRLVEDDSVRDSLLKACSDTVQAMQQISILSPSAAFNEIENHFRTLGALSSFAVSWPWADLQMWRIAEIETCAGQLVNDCNDCFGAKAVRRNYPDIRNRQVSLLLGIVHNYYGRHDFAERVEAATADQCAAIARDIFDEVRKKPEGVLAIFDGWMNEAAFIAQSLEAGLAQEWTKMRIANNGKCWRQKLQGLILAGAP